MACPSHLRAQVMFNSNISCHKTLQASNDCQPLLCTLYLGETLFTSAAFAHADAVSTSGSKQCKLHLHVGCCAEAEKPRVLCGGDFGLA